MASATRVFQIEGLDDLDRRLEHLGGRSARAVVRTGVNSGLTVVSKAIRREITAEPGISTQLKASLKRAVGKRFKKRRNQDALDAKAGFGVGKRKAAKRSGKNKGSGVGLSNHNVHWFALGTKLRRVKSTGKQVGKITQVKVIRRAYASSRSATLQTMRTTALTKLESEVTKLRNGV